MNYRLGVDIGGTFTDFALFDTRSGSMAVHKQLTTPEDPSIAVIAGTRTLLERHAIDVQNLSAVIHGTTLINNAVIERKGALTGMLTTKGFRDVLDIGMERRYDLFDLRLKFPIPLVPRRLRVEVDERVLYDGKVAQALDLDQARQEVTRLVGEHGIEALAVGLVHSYVNSTHEDAIRAMVEKEFPALYVCTSAEVAPFMREFERWTTTTINAFTQPLADRYLGHIETGLHDLGFRGSFLIMSSSGGTVTAATARRFPVRTLDSGPAAGVLMSAYHGRLLGDQNLLSFDMGGTTAKGSLIREQQPLRTYELEVARVHEAKKGSGLPVKIPIIHMIEIGAGGGGIAEVDERGLIRVGPNSAGADPGPACYGRGGVKPTLTDANLVLGYLDPEFFLGGARPLDRAAAETVITEGIARPLDIELARAAWGIHEIINEDVARAFRVHASERGFDYRSCTMVAFGGSGPLHALRIARKLQAPRVVFPSGAGVMSAFGLLVSPLSFELVRSNRKFVSEFDSASFEREFVPLIEEASQFLIDAGIERTDIKLQRRLDMRYFGQGYDIEVVLPDGPADGSAFDVLPDEFARTYEKVFSMSFIEEPLEIVNWKVEVTGPTPQMGDGYQLDQSAPGGEALKGTRTAFDPSAGSMIEWDVYDRYALKPGDRLTGPALVEETESTCVIGAGDSALVDDRYNLIAEIAEGEDA